MFVILFGVLLPALTLSVGIVGRLCRKELFNPLPTPLHVVLVGLVPVLLGLLLLPVAGRFPRLSRIALGLVLMVTSVYSALFSPLAPLAVIGIIFYGLGILALSPFFALAAAIISYFIVAQRSQASRLFRIAPIGIGLALGAVLFAAPILRTQWFERELTIAHLGQGDRAFAALRNLRGSYGEELLLDRCTHRGRREGLGTLLTGELTSTLSADDSEKLYYRITGRICSAEDWDDDFLGFGERNRAVTAIESRCPSFDVGN
ncbi:MAG: hypothetical protein QM784_18865 [Polyangiaceae bacterium]